MKLEQYRKQIVLLADVTIFVLANYLLCLLAWEFDGSTLSWLPSLLPGILLLLVCTLLCHMVFRTYDSLWRYAGSREYLILFAGSCGGGLLYLLLSPLLPTPLPLFYLTAVASISLLGMLLIRFAYRLQRGQSSQQHNTHTRIPVAIIGAGNTGVRLLNELQLSENSRYRVLCFFDDSPEKIGKRIVGVPVHGNLSTLQEYLPGSPVEEVILAIPSLSNQRRQQILHTCSQLKGIRTRVLPDALVLMESGAQPLTAQLREICIEDLLGRDPIRLNTSAASAFISGKTVLVTGGGGSIGSELCRQIAALCPKHLIILDIYENNAYDIQQELQRHYGSALHLTVEIASVRDAHRINQIFSKYRPQIVLHAAAHKHVPLMETSPQEAIRNNVFGTLNVVLAADRCGVSKFVQISTDKAVNPTNVMGATKRMCEMILQSMSGRSKTDFVAVRFGNVLGSNGSVIPLFRQQIADGGPLTITDKRIIRYFMTIPEAAQLVLEAATLAKRSELFVLDMGEPVKILDLAENLIRLSGYEPYAEIDIQEVGLRPGEKLYEELLIGSRDIEKTENQKIFIEHQIVITPEELSRKLTLLSSALETDDIGEIRRALHLAVPTFQDTDGRATMPNFLAACPLAEVSGVRQMSPITP